MITDHDFQSKFQSLVFGVPNIIYMSEEYPENLVDKSYVKWRGVEKNKPWTYKYNN
jgi:hypothetical protein